MGNEVTSPFRCTVRWPPLPGSNVHPRFSSHRLNWALVTLLSIQQICCLGRPVARSGSTGTGRAEPRYHVVPGRRNAAARCWRIIVLRNRHMVRMVAPLALLAAQSVVCAQPLGKSEPSFKQPSLAPGVDYVVPSEAAIKATLDRVRDYFIGATPYHIIDTSTAGRRSPTSRHPSSRRGSTSGRTSSTIGITPWGWCWRPCCWIAMSPATPATATTPSRISLSSSTIWSISRSRRNCSGRNPTGISGC